VVGIEVAVERGQNGSGKRRVERGKWGIVEDVIEHHVAAEDDVLFGKALVAKVLHGFCCGSKEEGGEVVGDDAVDFLRHAAVEGAKACFYMIDREMLLGGSESTGEGGVGVAIDQHSIVMI
jgi:hypothetical protein